MCHQVFLLHLNDVAVGVFGIGADSDAEERLTSVRTGDHLQNIHEVVFVPGARHVPASNLHTVHIYWNNKAETWKSTDAKQNTVIQNPISCKYSDGKPKVPRAVDDKVMTAKETQLSGAPSLSWTR